MHANAFTGDERAIEDVALFAYATPRLADDRLAALRHRGSRWLAGDAFAPRRCSRRCTKAIASGTSCRPSAMAERALNVFWISLGAAAAHAWTIGLAGPSGPESGLFPLLAGG